MCLDAVIPLKEDRPRLKLSLGDSEAIFDDPPSSVHLDDFSGVVFEVCTDTLEAIETLFLLYHLLIERKSLYPGKFTIFCAVLLFDEAFGVVLALAQLSSCALINDFLSSGNLLFTRVTQVVAVFKREGYYESLLQVLAGLAESCLYPTFTAKECICIFLGVQLG